MKHVVSHGALARLNARSSRVSAVGEPHATAQLPFGDAAFAAVFDTSAEALVVVNAKGIIQRCNPRAGEMLHRQESELQQADLGNFLIRPSAEEFSRLCVLQAGSSALSTAEGLLVSGFPVRISFRASAGWSATSGVVPRRRFGGAARGSEMDAGGSGAD